MLEKPHGPNPAKPILKGCARRLAFILVPLVLIQDVSADSRAAFDQTNQPTGSLTASAQDSLTRQLRAKLEEAQSDFNRLQAEGASATNLPSGATPREAIEYRTAVQMLAKTYQAHLDNLAMIEDIRQRREDFDRDAKAWTGFDEKPPYSILFVDNIRDTVQSYEDKIQLGSKALSFVDKLSANFAVSLKGHESELRRLNEQLEKKSDATQTARLNWLRELAQARSRFAAATLASFESLRQKTNEELSEDRLRLAFAQKQLNIAVQQVAFSKADLDRALETLNSERLELEAEAQSTYGVLEKSRSALAAARDELQRALNGSTLQAADLANIRRLQEIVEARDIQAQTDAEISSGLRHLLDSNTIGTQLWQTRYAIFNTHASGELQEAYKRLDKLNDLTVASREYFSQKATLTASQLLEQQNDLLLAPAYDTQRDQRLLQEKVTSLQQRALIYRRVLERVERWERLALRWKASLEWNQKNVSPADRLRNFFSRSSRLIADVWHFELFVAEATMTVDGQTIKGHRGVTVGKIAQALLMLVLGYWLSSYVARILQRLAAQRLGVEQNQANLIRRWILVALMTVLVIFSLVLVKIPLTVFTFAGGALAIGFGFGMQNLIKNFISGIIILFERPFRVDDVLDINGKCGTVTGIGFRSSTVLFYDGTETLIPNSSLLENNLTNCTFSSKHVRFKVAVGVAYGTDTALVTRLLSEVADRHGLVRKDPAPQILFTEISDSTLCFEIRFWVDVSKHNSAQVTSDLHHMIVKSFTERGISMAFPQRDIHLDSSRPLRVQLSRPEVVAPAP